jgi:predicted Zn-dependent protease
VPSKYDVNHIGDRGVGNGANKYSLERERKLGHALAQHVELSSKLVTDPVITEYVNRLGQRIVGNSDAQVPFTIKVIESDEINAFTLPGGYLYVDTGLILAADNEAEVAGVMAHEVAHVAARHETRAKTRKEIWRYASIPLVFGGLGVVTPMLFMKFGRDAEREADLLGLEYEYAAGYDPQAFIQFFEKLQTKEEQKQNLVAKAFATHPPTEDRIRRAQKEISSLLPDKAEYVVDTSEFQEVKARVANLTHEGPKDRCCFQANLWGPPHPDQDIRQVWFSGFHSDVGGSYSESEAGLSKVSFEWILVEAQKASAKKKSSTRSQSQIEKSL